MSEISDKIAFTSKIMAAIRAVEHERSDRLFSDPFAAQLAGEDLIIESRQKIEDDENKGVPYVAVRTRYFDDWLLSIVDKIEQFVILGSGLDTRAFRLNLPCDLRVYELDQEEVIRAKNTILEGAKPKCYRECIGIDLREPWGDKLLESGYQPHQPTAWLLEGLLYYLKEDEVHKIFQSINKLSLNNSYLCTDFINEKMLKGDSSLAQYWQFGCDEPESWLKTYGWEAKAVMPCEDEANYGRYTFQMSPRNVPDAIRIFFITAEKKPES